MVGSMHALGTSAKRYRLTLTPDERTLAHARILLKADTPPDLSGSYDADIAAAVEVSVPNMGEF